MPESQACHYITQLILVLEYLHMDLCVCHRDVKAENLLLDRHNNIRVIDFGLSNQFTSTHPLLNTACGSPPYVPPEMIKGRPYAQSADIWSAGILLYFVTTGMLPFDDENLDVLLRKIVTMDVIYPIFLSAQLVDLLRRMLMKNPETRITIKQIKEHEWFSQSHYVALFQMQLGERSTESIVDRETLAEMAQMGVETQHLEQQLLLHAFTELTAIYRMIRRNRLTDSMKEFIGSLQSRTTRKILPDDLELPKRPGEDSVQSQVATAHLMQAHLLTAQAGANLQNWQRNQTAGEKPAWRPVFVQKKLARPPDWTIAASPAQEPPCFQRDTRQRPMATHPDVNPDEIG
jgi:serine/threonine protein kinase